MEEQALALAMSTHKRLGEQSACKLPRDILLKIMENVEILVPQQCTLHQALQIRTGHKPGGAPLRIRVTRGEHPVGNVSKVPNGPRFGNGAENILHVNNRNVIITGEPGAKLRGMLVFGNNSNGRIENIELVDGGDCCVLARGGEWVLENCKIRCGHASAVRTENAAKVSLKSCVVGGEGRIRGYTLGFSTHVTVQDMDLPRHACFALFAKGRSSIQSEECDLQYCSESAVFMNEWSTVSVRGCSIRHSRVAFTAGSSKGRALTVEQSLLACVGLLWFDDDRPNQVEIDGHTLCTPVCEECSAV